MPSTLEGPSLKTTEKDRIMNVNNFPRAVPQNIDIVMWCDMDFVQVTALS